jgi:glycyl-tRNA synthetase
MSEPKSSDLMEKIVSLCKRRGLIFQSSEIYGGLNGFWDYGPLGAELKRNIKECWWRSMTRLRDDVVGLDASIIMHPKIWEASGHTSTFSDLMVDCLLTKKRFRADQVEPQSGTAYFYAGAYDGAKFNSLLNQYPQEYRKGVEDKIHAVVAEMEQQISEHDTEKLIPTHDQHFAEFQTEYHLTGCPTFHELRTAYAGAYHKRSKDGFSVLIATGKHADYARKVAKQFYQQRGIENPALQGERTEEVKDTTRYNPENGGLLTEPRPFNLMLKTYVGPVESEDNKSYLRPETAQAIFVQFKNVLDVSRQRVPFGICQTGKAFRNEINPRNFTFRSREFEQMELEFFIRPDEVVQKMTGAVAILSAPQPTPLEPQPNWGWELWHKYWVEQRIQWYESIGLGRDTLVEYWQKKEELAHYARACVDILFKFPFGTQELEGIAARSDFDLTQHQKFSGKSMEYFDEEAKAKYVPHVIEPSAGVDRLALALICNAYCEDQAPDEKGKLESRVVMKFHPRIAPIKVAVFPLLKNKPELVKKAKAVRDLLRPHMSVFYDEAGAIGRRYRRQDEAGTPFGITVDFDTLGEQGPALLDTVTLRDRDTMKQERVKIGDLLPMLLEKIR